MPSTVSEPSTHKSGVEFRKQTTHAPTPAGQASCTKRVKRVNNVRFALVSRAAPCDRLTPTRTSRTLQCGYRRQRAIERCWRRVNLAPTGVSSDSSGSGLTIAPDWFVPALRNR